MMRTYRTLPAIQSGYPLDEVWSVVVPIERTNLITNPSFETATTSWTAIGSSIARSTAQQYHGAYSLAITPTATTTDGVRYDTVSLTSGVTYAYSAKVRGVAGLKYKLAIETTGAVELASVTFTATGRWQWIVGYYTETSSTTRRVTARKAGHASTAVFYLDGVQVEALAGGETASTYIDGDQLGLVPNQSPIAYYWNGTPHASTSTRSGQTRAGGMVVPLSKYKFLISAIIGLGLAAPQNVATDYARIDGSYDDYTRKPARQITITGRFQGRTYGELRRNRSGLAQLIDRDLVGQDQRLTLLRHVEDSYGRVMSSDVRLAAKYESGFGGNTDNMHAEQVPITFTLYMPNILADGEDGEALNVQTSVTNANYVIKRAANGTWSALGTGGTAAVQGIAVAPDGKVYVCGSGTFGGVANTNRIAYWDGSAWNAMGTGSSTGGADAVYGVVIAPNGTDIIAFGTNTAFGGVANTANLAKWNGSVWSSITGAGSANGSVLAAAYDSAGNLYVAGSFTTINGVAANRVAKMTPAGVWSALSTGLNGTAESITVDAADNVYIGGDFTTPATRITKWNGSAFSALGSGFDSTVWSLKFDSAGRLYAAGAFTLSGSVSLTGIALWNGVAWSALGGQLTGGTSVLALATVPGSGLVYLGGAFTTAGGVPTPDSLAVWNGASYGFPNVDLPGSAIVNALALSVGGDLYVGYSTSGTATAGSSTTITNTGSARAYPTIKINGPSSGSASRVWAMVNVTTNRAIYFDYAINVGETATLVFTPDGLSFISTFPANQPVIVAGSNEADFFLQPGANVINMLVAGSTITITITWRPAYASIDDVP